MTRVALQVDGARELRKQAKAAAVDLDDMKAAHKDIAEHIKGWSMSLVPVVTGTLAASMRASGTAIASTVRAGNNTSVRYANPIHWGWPRRNIEPQPWLLTTAIEREPDWLDTYLAAVEKILKTIKGKQS